MAPKAEAQKAARVDVRDPIYDSESEDDDCVFENYEPKGASYVTASDMPSSIGRAALKFHPFVAKAKDLLNEFFATGEIKEALDSLKKLSSPHYLDYFVVLAIRLALDKSDAEQKGTAELLTFLYDSHVLTRGHLSRGFEKLIQSIEDLRIDVPDAADRVMSFFMCAEEDKLIDSTFMRRLPEEFLVALLSTAHEEDAASVKLQLAELREFKASCSFFDSDFFNCGHPEEVRRFLDEHVKTATPLRHEFVKHLVKASFDKNDWEREMVSKALSECYDGGTVYLGPDDIQLGFSRLIGSLDDLCLDCPEAPTLLAKFLVRAVVDEIVPPVFAKHQNRLHIGGSTGLVTLNKLQGWLKHKKGHMFSQQFRKIWTGTDPQRLEARDFKQEAHAAVFEYFENPSLKEAQQCINQMDLSPDQATEFVRKLMSYAMERTKVECEAALNLISHLVKCGELELENVVLGFDQLHHKLPDLSIDIPTAATSLADFQRDAIARDLLPKDYVDPLRRSEELRRAK